MLFATAYHRVCYGRICRTVPVAGGLRGLGDTIDTTDPCATNPSDPICIQFYGGLSPAEQAAASSAPTVVGGMCATDAECADGYTCNAATGVCEPITSSAAGASMAAWWKTSVLNPSTWGKPTGSMPVPAGSAAAAVGMGKTPWGLMIAVALLGGAAYGGIRLYEKRKRKT